MSEGIRQTIGNQKPEFIRPFFTTVQLVMRRQKDLSTQPIFRRQSRANAHRREGGIIWHTQGSGKSLTMAWLAKWIREHQADARVLLITDRTELDDQIEQVFKGVNESIYRTSSGRDLLDTLHKSTEWLICSLVHKFRGLESEAAARDEAERDFISKLQAHAPKDFSAKGNIFVFVDEAHRTQSGKMHDAMKQLLPGDVYRLHRYASAQV